MQHSMKSFFAVTLLALLLFFIGGSIVVVAAEAVVSPGYDPNATLTGGVRYKSMNSGPDREIYLGVPDLGVGGNRVEIDAVWRSSNHVVYTYNPTAGNETTTVNTGVNTYNLTYPAAGFLDLGPLNYVQIDVVSRFGGATVDFNNVSLNGSPLGNFAGSGWSTWMVTGVDLSSGFTLEGDIVLTGTQPSSSELNKVEIKVGYTIPLEITTSILPDCRILNPYSQTLTTAGGVAPFNWTISAGALPDGLTLNSATGEISGTPTLIGTFNFTAKVTDAAASEAFKNLSILTESLPVRYGDPGDPINYDRLIQSAYDNCATGNVIQVQGIELSGDVDCWQDVEITLQGGFDEYYTHTEGFSTILGKMTISNGKVVIENIVVR